jgi:AraC-like DNA-binding protein
MPMMKSPPTVSVLVARLPIQLAEARGAGVAPLLTKAGVDPELLKNPDARISREAMDALWEAIPRCVGDESFGLHVAEQSAATGSLDLVEYIIRNSPDLGTAYRKAMRYQQLVHDDASFQMEVRVDCARLSWKYPTSYVARHENEWALAMLVLLGRRVTGVDWAPRAVAVMHPAPSDTAEHRRIFQAPITFSHDVNELIIDREILARPVLGADPSLYALLARHAEERLARIPVVEDFLEQVRRQISAGLEGGAPEARDVARKLGLSQRSFERRLHNEGTTYREVVDAVRRELSLSYLREPRLRLMEISFLLGFAETSAFYRAFRRWTGTTPLEYRKRHAP